MDSRRWASYATARQLLAVSGLCRSGKPVRPGGAALSTSRAGGRDEELRAGRLVVVALRDSARAPRHLAVIKGPAAGNGNVLLALDAQQEVAVRQQNIKLTLPADGPDAAAAAASASGTIPLHAPTSYGRLC